MVTKTIKALKSTELSLFTRTGLTAVGNVLGLWIVFLERIGYEQTSSMLTAWKKEEELDFLNDVSCVPLQQGLRHLQSAFTNFFAGRAKYPNFKKKHQGGSAEFTKSAFKFKNGQIYLAKWALLDQGMN